MHEEIVTRMDQLFSERPSTWESFDENKNIRFDGHEWIVQDVKERSIADPTIWYLEGQGYRLRDGDRSSFSDGIPVWDSKGELIIWRSPTSNVWSVGRLGLSQFKNILRFTQLQVMRAPLVDITVDKIKEVTGLQLLSNVRFKRCLLHDSGVEFFMPMYQDWE